MKLLHFGLFDKREPQQALRDALKGICDKYMEHSFIGNVRNARRDFITLMKRKPDVVFMQVQCPDIITPDVLKYYKTTKIFNFSGDVVPVMPKWYKDIGRFVTTLFTNTDWVNEMRSHGYKSEYFQIGFDHNIYKPDGARAQTKPVVFMGNYHNGQFPLSKLRQEMVERFKNKEWFQVYGRGWGTGVVDLNHRQQQEAAVYRGAKIGINLSHLDLGSYTSDRMFRLMGSGCMCLAYKHKDIEKEFENGYNIMTWSDLDELEHQINKMISIGDIRTIIAQNGCGTVHTAYTWPVRMNQLKQLL